MEENVIIPYDWVAVKMNFWYNRMKENDPAGAEDAKKEVQKELKQMEENQDALLYYQLLEFRHNLMMSYMFPNSVRDLHTNYDNIIASMNNKKLNGLLEYYYYFFSGMYYFRQMEFTHSLRYYIQAEKCLKNLGADAILEQAEFYFKIAEAYYHMKQTHFSMFYADEACRLFKNQTNEEGKNIYGVQLVRCEFVKFGNLLDNYKYDKALKKAEKTYLSASKLNKEETNREYLIRAALFNLGLCYHKMEELEKSVTLLCKSLAITNPEDNNFMATALFLIAYTKGKQKDYTGARDYFNKSKHIAEKANNKLILAKLEMVEGLFIEDDLSKVREAFEFFNKNNILKTRKISVSQWVTSC
ncbi:Rap family tetratricopeptide repeat protein [Bacillus changyiensis]|uniref:Rap family tetratricopeptide repeat protein n=1 Tax=Bacillus changyiensis TaxID=3004103 RepID=UPI0022E4BDAA|nr:Rap family tetratricopeptide repeat protein [Bacillus changyiensis]MDA1475009.1 tetratricopeptide repeat protein [Bacillus changyiensis]